MTVQKVYDAAIKLMNEQRDASGETMTPDTVDYKNRCIDILNSLIVKAFPYSDTFYDGYDTLGENKKPTAPRVSAFTDTIGLDESISAILCYGLAARLEEKEDPAFARDMMAEFDEQLVLLARSTPTVSEPIEDLYGGNEWGQFSRW